MWQFQVWAPNAQRVELCVLDPHARLVGMAERSGGYWEAVLEGIGPGARYVYRLNGGDPRPDPASRSQPEGVHGPSELVSAEFGWTDGGWHGLPLERYILYELHTGTFTGEGSFEAVIPHLQYLKNLGVTAIELMPIAQFPGGRNWGYDGVGLYAAQNSYGGPAGLRRLVDACHAHGLAVTLDVVYNHLGPEGNYLAEFGPYFTGHYATPWGKAVNYDDEGSDRVRRFVIENALYWITDCHIDALRLDAVHAIYDQSAVHVLEELGEEVHRRARELNRQVMVIAESSLNNPRLVRRREVGGYGLDGQWNDEFHHAMRTLLTGDLKGYYEDYGEFGQLAKAWREGYVYTGEYSRHRKRKHGAPSRDVPGERFVVFSQNHDHVGNRMLGERLTQLTDLETLKLAAAMVLLSPYVPMLFMGEEYGEPAPFQYFVSHGDRDLVEAVRNGRKAEFASFAWQGEPPDPQAEETFERAKLNHELRKDGKHAALLEYYRELIALRKSVPALALLDKDRTEVSAQEAQQVLQVRRWSEDGAVLLVFHLGESELAWEGPGARWRKVLDSTAERWGGPGEKERVLQRRSVAVYRNEQES